MIGKDYFIIREIGKAAGDSTDRTIVRVPMPPATSRADVECANLAVVIACAIDRTALRPTSDDPEDNRLARLAAAEVIREHLLRKYMVLRDATSHGAFARWAMKGGKMPKVVKLVHVAGGLGVVLDIPPAPNEGDSVLIFTHDELETLKSREREMCAKVCEDLAEAWAKTDAEEVALEHAATSIRKL